MLAPADFYDLSQYLEDTPSSIPITVQHPTPDTAVFELEGVTYTATREKVRPRTLLACDRSPGRVRFR